MKFLGDTTGSVKNGVASIGGITLDAAGCPDGAAEVYARPGDLNWSRESGIPATVLRVVDRPDGRHLVARTASGETVELDVPPETVVRAGDESFLRIVGMQVW